jgi:hypothetical protein
MASKPKPKDLGTGAAKKAADKLSGRKAQIDKALRDAGAKATPKKKKKTAYA